MAKMRSPNYPSISLRESYQRVKLLWHKERKTAVPADVAAKAIGYSGISGPSRTALSAMKKFGLVDSDDRSVRVSELALRILHPANETEATKALQQAALKPELFQQIYTNMQEASDDAVRSFLITKLDFSEAGANQFIKAYRDTMDVASLSQPNSKPLIELMPADEMQMADSMTLDMRPAPSSTPHASRMPAPAFHTAPSQTITVPVGPDVIAEVRLVGGTGELKQEHLTALIEYLTLAQKFAAPKAETGGNKGTEPEDRRESWE
jgi:hypothetical protein